MFPRALFNHISSKYLWPIDVVIVIKFKVNGSRIKVIIFITLVMGYCIRIDILDYMIGIVWFINYTSV